MIKPPVALIALLVVFILIPVDRPAMAEDLSFTKIELAFENPLIGSPGVLRVSAPDRGDLIVRTRSDVGAHTLHLFDQASLKGASLKGPSLKGPPRATRTIVIPRQAIFFAHGEMPEGEREKLLILTNEGVLQYDFESNAFHLLQEIRSIFRQGTDLRFSRSGFAQDINDDQRFDLMIPDFDAMQVFIQQADGSFAPPVRLPVAPEMRLTGEFSNDNVSDTEFSAPVQATPTFKVFPSYIFDATGDQRSDIVFHVGRSFQVFAQTPAGSFSTTAQNIDFTFEVRGNRWLDDIQAQERNADQSKFRDVTVYRILDLDEDGVSDVVTVANEASGVFDRRQKFSIYRGRFRDGLISYQEKADHEFSLEGIGGVGFRDINNDGRRDLMATSVKISIGKIISFLVSRSLKTRTRVYIDDGTGNFAENEKYRRSYSIAIDLARGQARNPPLRYHDFNNDGMLDLLIGENKRELSIYQGSNGDPFKTRIANLTVPLPGEGALVEALDINSDQREDIVIRYSRLGFDGAAAGRKLVLFLSR